MPLTSGDRFTGFTITEFLGTSPVGSQYKVSDSRFGGPAHLTILDSAGSPSRDREREFRRTNEILMRMQVRGAARILDFGSTERNLWIVTEFISGIDAGRLLRQRFETGMSHKGVCLIADHVARTLDDAARGGISHGDISPANIVISDPFSSEYRIAVCSFGLRELADAPAGSAYSAPEVLSGGPATNAGDQFSLAATTFHLLTGRRPFGDSKRTVTAAGSLQFDAGPVRHDVTGVDGLERVFARAFAFDPAQRFDSCRAFAAALVAPPATQKFTPRPPAPIRSDRRPAPPREPGTAPAWRSKLLPTAGVIVAVAALVIAAAFWPDEEDAEPTTAAAAPTPLPTPAAAVPESACAPLDATLAGLTLRQKLAQTLMVGITGIEDARAVVNDHQVGGIFIGSWTDLSMLESGQLRELQGADRPIPLAVSIDEEGGRVQRLRSLIGSQDSPRQLVAQGTTPRQVRDIAFERGSRMRDYGITIDFAPVVDITDAADDTVIGDRSFGNDPATVIEYAGAYAQGLRDAGLLPVLKHFPGHGRASGDSHINGVTTPPIDGLLQTDTVPYRTLTTQRPVAVMLGHMEVPGLTGTDPASLSEAAYSLLRQGGYGGPAFDGPVFTDDLSSMGAINQRYSVPDAVLKSLTAGADTALWISTDEVPAVLDRLESAVGNGELAAERVDDAVRQMAVTKDPALGCTR